MVRTSWVLLVGALLALAGSGQAAEDGAAGTWKFSFVNSGRMTPLWLVKLEKKDDKWTGSVPSNLEGVPPGTVENLTVGADRVSFTLKLKNNLQLAFEGKSTGKEKKVLGVLTLGREKLPAELEPTSLKTLDTFEVNKEAFAKETGPQLFNLAKSLLSQAEEKKVKPEEVRGWANRAFTAAEPYGPFWQREVALKTSAALLGQEGYGEVALEYARKAKRMLEPQDSIDTQMSVLTFLASALEKTGKAEEANAVELEADTIYLKRPLPFKPEKFEGRKKKSDRAVLVELFTGAECPPCVAADVAFDGVAKSYAPNDVILLQYHLHIPRPDPLTNEDNVARSRYYEDEVEGTPSILFNGKLKAMASGGGQLAEAKEKYKAYRDAIDPLLETATPVKLTAKAVRKGDKIDITAEATELEKPGEKVRLRLALVEELVRYPGGNALRFHHHVVRALPGGADGLALKAKSGKQEITVDLSGLKEKLNNYLNDYGKKARFPSTRRPMDLKNLYVVAFVQNDESKEILQAIQVKVEPAN